MSQHNLAIFFLQIAPDAVCSPGLRPIISPFPFALGAGRTHRGYTAGAHSVRRPGAPRLFRHFPRYRYDFPPAVRRC